MGQGCFILINCFSVVDFRVWHVSPLQGFKIVNLYFFYKDIASLRQAPEERNLCRKKLSIVVFSPVGIDIKIKYESGRAVSLLINCLSVVDFRVWHVSPLQGFKIVNLYFFYKDIASLRQAPEERNLCRMELSNCRYLAL